MKLIGHEEGRSLQLISMDEVRPLNSGVYPVDALRRIANKYKFVNPPNAYEPNTTIKFETGLAEIGTVKIPIMSLEIYSDGILVSARNTGDSDIVLEEFIRWATEEFGFRERMTVVPRKYVSRIIVDVDGDFDNLAAPLRALGLVTSEAFGVESSSLSITSLHVGPHPPTQYPYQTTWQLTRRVVEPLVPNRYLSAAPLSSDDHYNFLVSLEHAVRRA